MSDLKNTLESLLFSSGKKMSLEELSKLSKEKDLEIIKRNLEELKKELDEKNSSLMLIQEGDSWKLTVREKYLPFIRKIITQTELPKSVLETLAVVAFKAPGLQSEVIKIRTNKAYKHLDELELSGYITREKKGRTKLIKLTQKFFEYFDIPEKELKQKLKSVADERELEPNVEVYREELNNLEVYEATPEKRIRKKIAGEVAEKAAEPVEGAAVESTKVREGAQELVEADKEVETKAPYKSKGLFGGKIPKELEERIDKRVEEIVSGKSAGEVIAADENKEMQEGSAEDEEYTDVEINEDEDKNANDAEEKNKSKTPP